MNKKLIAILTLVMFAVTLLPMGAFAASRNTSSGFLPTIADTGQYQLANVRISADGIAGNFEDGFFTIDLPVGVAWLLEDDTPDGTTFGAGDWTNAEAAVETVPGIENATRSAARTMTIELDLTPEQLDDEDFSLSIPVLVNITSMGSGDILATITDVDSGVSSGTVTVGRFTVGQANARMLSVPTTGDSNFTPGTIRFTENSGGALASGETVTLRLPNGFTWDANEVTISRVTGTANLEVVRLEDNDRRGVFRVTNTGNQISVIDLTVDVDVDTTTARFGDVSVTIGGTASIDPTSLVIARYADFATEVTARAAETVYSGKAEQDAARVTIKEGLKESILANRDINLRLPSGVRFAETPNVTLISGNLSAGGNITTSLPASGRAVVRLGSLSSSSLEMELRNIKLDVAANFEGDIVLTVDGPAGVEGSVVIAEAVKPVTVETTPVELQLGKQSQRLNDIYVTETVAEAIESGTVGAGDDAVDATMTFRLPAGSEWSKIPTIEVVEGDIDFGTATRSGRDLVIPVDAASSVASKFAIRDIEVTTDRTIAEGNMNVTLTGPAVVSPDAQFVNRNTMASVRVATLVTPATDGVVQEVVMTVGSTIYTVGGVEMAMDVAPYIKNGRTFFPVRFVSQAVGVATDNVLWDGPSNTVTIFRGNRIVQMTIGSTTMLVNGIPLTMDVAPEITASRTMLPIRFLGQGLGINVDWDAATQTVTLN